MFCFHFERPPILAKHPELPLLDEPSEYGEIWIKYPLVETPVRLHLGLYFDYLMELRKIITELACLVYSPHRSEALIQLPTAWEYYRKLRNWFDRLSGQFGHRSLVLPIHFQLQ
jgi:hypothetical protein